MQQYAEANITLTTPPQLIAPANITRLALVLSVPSNAARLAINPSNLPNSGSGGLTVSSTVPVIMTRADWGLMVCLPWYAMSNIAATVLYVGQLYDPNDPFDLGSVDHVELPDFARDPHTQVAGVDVPDPIGELIRQLRQRAAALPR